MALERVDNECVLLRIFHRDCREMHPGAVPGGEAVPDRHGLVPHLERLGVVVDPIDGWARKNEVCPG